MCCNTWLIVLRLKYHPLDRIFISFLPPRCKMDTSRSVVLSRHAVSLINCASQTDVRNATQAKNAE